VLGFRCAFRHLRCRPSDASWPIWHGAAFEPDPVAFRRLCHHVRKNDLAQVQLFNAAVSDAEAPLKLSAIGRLGSSMYRISDTGELTVPAIVPDRLVDLGQIGLPAFIKVDIEGYGHAALKGSQNSIKRSRPTLLFNCHSQEELAGAQEVVAPLGYARVDLAGRAIAWSDHTPASVLVPA
jgi:FkbM family methyltransferase